MGIRQPHGSMANIGIGTAVPILFWTTEYITLFKMSGTRPSSSNADVQKHAFITITHRRNIHTKTSPFTTWESVEKIWFALQNFTVGTHFPQHVPL